VLNQGIFVALSWQERAAVELSLCRYLVRCNFNSNSRMNQSRRNRADAVIGGTGGVDARSLRSSLRKDTVMRSFRITALALIASASFAAQSHSENQTVSDAPGPTVLSQSGAAPSAAGPDTSIPEKIGAGQGNVRQSPAVAGSNDR
jgi:hypothetical protein